MSNELWTCGGPTEQGMYYVNVGDVVTKDTCSVINLSFKYGTTTLIDDRGDAVDSYGSHCKFLPVDFEKLNKIGSN